MEKEHKMLIYLNGTMVYLICEEPLLYWGGVGVLGLN